MDSCLRAFLEKFFKKNDYQKIDTTDIELVEHRFVARDIYYKADDIFVNLSKIIMFHREGLEINGNFIRYEYIPVINTISPSVIMLPTFTIFDGGKIIPADNVSNIYIKFGGPIEAETFCSNLMSKMIYVKDVGGYDKNVFKFKSIRKFIIR